MNKLILFLSAICMTVTAMAKTPQETKQLEQAVQLLTEVSAEQASFQVAPHANLKEMIKELALTTGEVELEEDFEKYFSEDNSGAWNPDSMDWSIASLMEAQSYVVGKIPELVKFRKEQEGVDTTGMAEEMLVKTQEAFALLKQMKSVKYGVAPMGGEQCGVVFPAILVIDTETGTIHSISMDSSGC